MTLKQIDKSIRAKGHEGSYRAVRYRARDVRRGVVKSSPFYLARDEACRLLWQWTPEVLPTGQVGVSELLTLYPELSTFCFIYGFREALRNRDPAQLRELLGNRAVLEQPRLSRFVRRARKDIDVLLAACSHEENNGFVEGNINRLKTIKRMCYGRAKFDFLRIRVLCRNPDAS